MNYKNVTLLLAICLCLLITIPSTVTGMSNAEEPQPVFHPQIMHTEGPVMVKGGKYAIWQEAKVGMLLLSGDILRTEKGGFVKVEFASGKVDLYENTVIIIPSIDVQERKKDIRDVIVDEGKALFNINPLGVENGFQFRTKNVQGGVKGTIFTVSYLNQGTAVNVYKGVVQVSDNDLTPGTMTSLTAGRALRVEKDSKFGNVKGFDPDFALEDYKYNIPPGLKENGLPADYNAHPDNMGERDRGKGHGRDNAPGLNK